MPTHSPQSLDASGQKISGGIQAPEHNAQEASASQMEQSSSSTPSRLRSIASAAAMSLLALTGCADDQNSPTPGSTPGPTLPGNPPPTPETASLVKGGPFASNLNFCRKYTHELRDPQKGTPARPNGLRTFLKIPAQNDSNRLYRLCSTPAQYGNHLKTGLFENPSNYSCDNNGTCYVHSNATYGAGANGNSCYVVRRADANSQYKIVVGNSNVQQWLQTLKRGHYLDDSNNLYPLGNTEFDVYMGHLQEPCPVGKTTPSPAPTTTTPVTPTPVPVTPRPRPVPVEKNCTSCEHEKKQDNRLTALERRAEDNEAVDARQDGDIGVIAAGVRSNRDNINAINGLLNEHKHSDDGRIMSARGRDLAREE